MTRPTKTAHITVLNNIYLTIDTGKVSVFILRNFTAQIATQHPPARLISFPAHVIHV